MQAGPSRGDSSHAPKSHASPGRESHCTTLAPSPPWRAAGGGTAPARGARQPRSLAAVPAGLPSLRCGPPLGALAPACPERSQARWR